MRPQSAMKLHMLLAVSFSWALREAPLPPKYQHRDPVTSEVRLCDQCPPGTAVLRHCDASLPTVCTPCPERQFAEHWHWGESCQHCTAVCKERQLVRHECNGTQDRLCECVQGHYLVVEFCVRHTACPPGSGVATLGTPVSDTLCEKCPEGYFSSVESTMEPCVPHRDCAEQGLRTLHPGTATQDAVCEAEVGSATDCLQQQLQCDTDVTLCEEAIFHFLLSQRLSSLQLDRLVENLPGRKLDRKSVERIKKACGPHQRTLQLLKLWREQNKDQDKLAGIIRGVTHCERKVSRCASLKNLTLSDLVAMMESLPGAKVREEDVRQVVSSCPSQRHVLQLLHLWKARNGEQDLAKGLAQGLRGLRGRDVSRQLLRSIRRIGRIFSSSSIHKMHEKMFLHVIRDGKCFKSKSYND
ncbi:tumor necrosis factor receptor superfamily member 11B-like [Megalops cyprinoides]|uniref:tumor necrosis factor receptor superfamily member 11B-like n=1 Tax=Megalops cyprinoides TaxID=118141 RepID=UPI0018654FCC|nr:tumor necrosis factor receptor superfamily member 11B-like [Megalops cyprinoides]